jgi:1-deoxy-D-xylulose-5-phosphate synthase
MILKLAREHEVLITLEVGSVGGFGSMVHHLLADHGVFDEGLKIRSLVLPDEYTDHDKPDRMYGKAGLDSKGIVSKVFEVLQKTEQASKGRA